MRTSRSSIARRWGFCSAVEEPQPYDACEDNDGYTTRQYAYEVQHAESSVASCRHRDGRRTVSRGCCRRSGTAAAFALRPLHGADPDLQGRARHLYQADVVDEQGGTGVLRPGLPDDVFVCQARGRAVVPRDVEAGSGVRDLLLGRGLGVGLVPERPDDRRGIALRVRGCAEGVVVEG